MPIISVIVPVYKVEKYLDKCVLSIINQTFRDYELILVDDGSPDSCGQQCEAYKEKDSRIRVIHKENGGLSSARNAGLDAATGEYVSFIDSDDFISPNMLEILYTGICFNKADMAACGINNVYGDLMRPQCRERKTFYCDGETAFGKIMEGNEIPASICNKMIRKDVIGSLRFPEGRLYEDAFFTAELMQKIHKVWVTTEPLYYYVHRKKSITTESFHAKGMDVIYAYEKNMEVVKEHYPALIVNGEFRLLWGYFVVLDRILNVPEYKLVPEYKQVKDYLKEHWVQVLKNPYFTKSRKIGMVFLKINAGFYRKLVRMKQRKEELYD